MATAELETKPAQELVTFSIKPISYEVTKAEIEKVVSGAMMLRVTDANDKEGLERCTKELTKLQRMTSTIEKQRVAMKRDSLEYGRQVDATAKELAAPLENAKAHLNEQRDIVRKEQERLEKEAEEKRQAVTRERLNLLKFVGAVCLAEDVAGLSDADFNAKLAAETQARDERQRKAAEEKAEQDRIAEQQRLEREKIEKEKAELEERQAAANRRLMVMQKRIERMATLGHQHPHSNDQLADMSNEQWQELVDEAEAKKAEREKAAKAEQERLDAQKKEQELAQQRIDAELDRIYKARKSELMEISVPAQFGEPGVVVITRDTTEDEYQVVLAKAKEWKSQYDAHVAAEEKAAEERKAAEAKAKAEAAAAELARLESLRPDADKILAFITEFQSLEFPTLSPACKEIAKRAHDILNNASEQIFELADELAPTSEAA